MSGIPPKFMRRLYLFFCTDPVHIGTGGYRLGRVDNSMVREPGTNVPKVPGTSLHGAARSYAASLYEKLSCAGQGGQQADSANLNEGHCGTCKICHTFGYTKNMSDGKQQARSGAVNVFDAHILLFPVHSMRGPVWITTQGRLGSAGIEVPEPAEENVLPVFSHEGKLNLGWLMFDTGRRICLHRKPHFFDLGRDRRWKEIAGRIVVVHDSIFSHLVNSNMEVRTSVSIDPFTGAAKDKALFTYEALPRTTVLLSDVVMDDYRSGMFKSESANQTHKKNSLPEGTFWNSPIDVLHSGLDMIGLLGVGGMGTRGFGRMSILGQPEETVYPVEAVS